MARLAFANQLRGLAALSVAVSHLVGVFWLMRDFVGLATFSPVQTGTAPDIVGVITLAWFQPGPFGVAIFFLISGLVVPISLERHSRLSFLGARLLRIYPTYFAALLIQLAVLAAAAAYWHKPFGYDATTIAANALLVFNLVDRPSVDLVNWTLAVEVKFYFLLALLAPAVRRGGVVALFALACLLLGVSAQFGQGRLAASAVAQALSTEASFLVFMLIGVLFNYRLRRKLSAAGFAVSLVAMSGIFVACWRSGALAPQYPVVTVNYGYALALFAALYAARRWARPTGVLDAAAAISFPFYLVHAMIGYSVMKVLMLSFGLAYAAALAVAVSVVVAIACVLHLTIERATIQAGRALAQRAPSPVPPMAWAVPPPAERTPLTLT